MLSNVSPPLYFSTLPPEVSYMVIQYSLNREKPNLAGQVDPTVPLVDLFAPAAIMESYSNFKRDFDESCIFIEVDKTQKESLIKEMERDDSILDKYERINTIKEEIITISEAKKAAEERFNILYPPRLRELFKSGENVFKLFKTALGGEEKYHQLPVLDIGDRNDSDHLDFIKPDEVTQPIMQGKGDYHRRFFVIKATYSRDQTEHIQVFYQRKGDWFTSGSPIVRADPFLQRGYLQTPRIIYDLHEVATKGSVAQQVILVENGHEEWIYSKQHTWTLIKPKIN